jgi:hypothetical protein
MQCSVIDSCRELKETNKGDIAGECTPLCSMPKISSKTIQVDCFISSIGQPTIRIRSVFGLNSQPESETHVESRSTWFAIPGGT